MIPQTRQDGREREKNPLIKWLSDRNLSLSTSLLCRCLTQSIAIQILININLLISIKIRLPLDRLSLASVWHCSPPHHPDKSPHPPHTQHLTLASIRRTVFVKVSTVIKKCPWCNFMPVDTHAPYAKDYGKAGPIGCGWGSFGHFMGTFNGLCRLCWAQNCPLGGAEKPQTGNPAPPTCDMNLCRSICHVSGFWLSEGCGCTTEAISDPVYLSFTASSRLEIIRTNTIGNCPPPTQDFLSPSSLHPP